MEKQINCKILPCSCKCVSQDLFYGNGKRLHNKMKNGNWRCTVCKKEKSG